MGFKKKAMGFFFLSFGSLTSTVFAFSHWESIAKKETLDSKYIQKLLGYGISETEALERARKRKIYDHWALNKIASLQDDFTHSIQSLELDSDFHFRLKKVYGLCVQSYGQDKDRIFMRKIEIGEPLSQYKKSELLHTPIEEPYLKTEYSIDLKNPIYKKEDRRTKGFFLLLAYAQKAQRDYLLDDFQSACMAKCIADEALTYVPLTQNPVTAIRAFLRSEVRSEVKNFENPYGVCTNYAKLTHVLALALGFGERVQIERKGKHFFNEFYIDGTWYHFHPLRKYGKECRFIPYSKSEN